MHSKSTATFGFLFLVALTVVVGSRLAEIPKSRDLWGFSYFPQSRSLLQTPIGNPVYPHRSEGFQTNAEYFVSVGLLAIPGFAIAVVVLIWGLIYCICYGCCGRCGRIPSNTGTNTTKQLVVRIFLVLFGIFVIGGVILGLVGSRIFTLGVVSVTQATVNVTRTVFLRVQNMSMILIALDNSSRPVLEPLNNAVVALEMGVRDVEDLIYAIEIFRNLIINFGFLLTTITGALAVAAGSSRANQLALSVAILGLICAFIMACSFGIHLPLSVFVDDLCFTVRTFLQNPRENNPVLNFFLTCIQNGSYFPAFEETVNITESLLRALNDSTTKIIGYSFDPTLPPQTTSLDDLIAHIVAKVNLIVSDVQQRISNSTNPNIGIIQTFLFQLRDAIGIFENLYEIVRCSFISQFVEIAMTSVCDIIVGGILIIYIANVTLIGLLLVLTIFGMVGTHLFKYVKSLRLRYSTTYVKAFRLQSLCVVQIFQIIIAFVLEIRLEVFFILVFSFWLAIALFGFLAATLRNRVLVLIYTIVQTIVFLLLVVAVFVLARELIVCHNPNDFDLERNCTVSYHAFLIYQLVVVIIQLILCFVSIVVAWVLFSEIRRTVASGVLDNSPYYELNEDFESYIKTKK
jgi:hypothetical protein